MSTSSHPHAEIPCPDPSVHSQLARGSGLQNNASKAALLAAESRNQSKASEQKIDPFGPDGKLSSASAATSLKYAKATDLPSFPVVGIEAQNSGNTAANLANANHKPFEWWKPEGESSSASKAATLAANKGANLNLWQYKPDGTGFSAASQAMAAKSSSPQLDYGYTEDGHKKALLAATLSTKKKANAAPTFEEPPVYPDSGNSAYNSLNAASVAHRQGYTPMSDKGNEASRIQYARGINASQYGSAPVIDSEEKRHDAALHAAAVSAAKSLYDIEKPAMERIAAGEAAATRAHGETYDLGVVNTSSDPMKMQATNYLKVHEAAQKLAAERLAKLDPDGVMAYQEHYGYGNRGQAAKLSVRGSRRDRNSAATNDVDSSDDEANAARVRNRTRGLNQQVASIDDQKRTKDREDLMAAAQRSVQARMSQMDEQVFNSTGKMSPAMTKEWEAKAQAKASADSAQRMQSHGKVHIGGGKYMDQSEIDAIAAARMQPTLDHLTATAELQRVRDAEIRADQDRKKEAARVEKEKAADVKAQNKMVHNQEKARVQAEKDAEKAERRRVKDQQKVQATDSKNVEATRLAQEKEAKRLSKDNKEQEAEEEKRMKDAQVEADRLQAEEAKAEKDADKAAVAEAEATEEAREADAHVAQAEAEDKADRASIEDVSPGANTRAVTSIETDRPSTATTITPATVTTTKRDSKVRGFFSRIRGGKEAPVSTSGVATEDASGEAYKSGTGAHDESAELKARAKGKQRAESEERANSVISPVDASDDEDLARTSVTSDDKWSEARDQFEVEETPRVSTGSPAMGGSKFQEDL